MNNRIFNYKMEYYHHVYKNSKMWTGEESLEGKRILIYCEQGYGDIIHFIRYLPQLKQRGCHIILHCYEPLHCLLPYIKGVDEWWDKYDETLPDHDMHVLSLDLPYLVLDKKQVDIQTWWEGKEQDKYMPQINEGIPPPPYIFFQGKAELPEGLNIGICWAGNPLHHNDQDRSCHLKYFKCLKGRLISLQKDIYTEYTQGAEDTVLWGTHLNTLLDVMQIINAVDVVVTVDTLIMHLAGAVGKTIFGMLGNKPDMRWPTEGYSPWYPTITFCQKKNDDWASAFEQLPSWLKISNNP